MLGVGGLRRGFRRRERAEPGSQGVDFGSVERVSEPPFLRNLLRETTGYEERRGERERQQVMRNGGAGERQQVMRNEMAGETQQVTRNEGARGYEPSECCTGTCL